MLIFSHTNAYSETEFKSKEAEDLAIELKHTINSVVSKIIELERSKSPNHGVVSVQLQQELKQSKKLGLVLDNNQTVLLVSPQSVAANLGIMPGDQLTSLHINAVPLNLSKSINLLGGQQVLASVIRDKETKKLYGVVKPNNAVTWNLNASSQVASTDATTTSNNSNCGRISIFATPPTSKDYYPVVFNQLNEKNIVSGRKVVRVKPGLHSIKLNENIDARGLRIHRPNFVKGKTLDIEIEPGKSYHLAAEFYSEKRMKSKGELYWKPIVWKVVDKECNL